MDMENTSSQLSSFTFARLPVFDFKKNLWGYELAYILSPENSAGNVEKEDLMTADLLSGTSLALDQMIDREKKIMVHFSRQNIVDNLPYALPPGRTIIKIKDVNSLLDCLAVLEKIKENGYQVAMEWNSDSVGCQSLFNLADMIFMDISAMGLPDLVDRYHACKPYNAHMMASRVDNQKAFDIGLQAGFSFFQGSFFKQPEDMSVKKMVPGTISRFNLLKAIEQSDPDFSDLAVSIQADVAVSFRLLSYLNSASFGFRRKIDTIKDAITMLGWQNLKNWLRVVLLSEVSENRHASELIFLSAQRGKFLEQVGKDHDFWGFEPDSLFLLGMFSLLDALLNQPMSQIVRYLPLADKLKGALCMEYNNEYVPLLKLAQYFEDAAFDQTDIMINQLGLDKAKVNQAYGGSIDWANKLCEIPS